MSRSKQITVMLRAEWDENIFHAYAGAFQNFETLLLGDVRRKANGWSAYSGVCGEETASHPTREAAMQWVEQQAGE